MLNFLKIFICCFCFFATTNWLDSHLLEEKKAKHINQNLSRIESKTNLTDDRQIKANENINDNTFRSLKDSIEQQNMHIEKLSNKIWSLQDDISILFYLSISSGIIIILLLGFLVVILIKGKFYNLTSEIFNRISIEVSNLIHQLSRTSRNLDLDLKQIKEKLLDIEDLILKSTHSRKTSNFPSKSENQSKDTAIISRELGVQDETQVVYVKYIGELESRPALERNNIPEYFYIKQQDGNWRLFVIENILNKRPSQEYEFTLNNFFDINKVPDPQRYELSESALIDWIDAEGKGYLKAKGKINQV